MLTFQGGVSGVMKFGRRGSVQSPTGYVMPRVRSKIIMKCEKSVAKTHP